MMTFDTGAPSTGPEIITALLRLQAESRVYLASLPTAEFFAPQGAAWSPGDHVRHLIKSVRPVARAMRAPRILLRVLFGRGRGVGRDFASVRAMYRGKLAEGAGAGRFASEPRPLPVELEAYREELFARWDGAVQDLADSIGRWSEADLDRYRLPHPILGKLAVREMLFFTVYHNAHHIRRVAERMSRSGNKFWDVVGS